MFKCEVCGREFETKQALGGHVSMAHANALAPAVRAAMSEALSRPTTRYPLPTTHYPLPTTVSKKPLPTTHYPLPATRLADDDLVVYEHRVRELEVRAKLRARERDVQGKGLRRVGIVLVMAGVLFYFLGGGKLKLPFFGEPQ